MNMDRTSASTAKKARNILAGFFFFLICLVFVFVGVAPSDNLSGGRGIAAMVGNSVISEADVVEAVRRQEERMGKQPESTAAERERRAQETRQSVVDNMVKAELGALAAIKSGIYGTEASIRELLVNADGLKRNGRFSREMYDMYLQSIGVTAGQFEAKILKEMAFGKARELFSYALKVPDLSQNYDRVLRDSKLEIEFALLDKNQSAKISDDEVAKFQENAENKKAIEAYYSGNKAQYETAESVRVRHILVSGTSPDSEKKAKEILARVKSNQADFEKIAKEVSEDPGSKDKGGDLGFILRGQMVKEFEEASFSLAKGKLSGLVRSSYGFHIIESLDKKEKGLKPLSEVTSDIARSLLKDLKMKSIVDDLKGAASDASKIATRLKSANVKLDSTGEFALNSFEVPKMNLSPDDTEKFWQSVAAGSKTGFNVESMSNGVLVYRLKKQNIVSAETANKSEDQFAMFASYGMTNEAIEAWVSQMTNGVLVEKF
jgi:peptidyl-prolyl cis-trans isomerase D